MTDVKVSILIPVYNREQYIAECIYSVLNQTYKRIEVIVVDNLSEDSTWDICKKIQADDDRVRLFRNKSNVGPVRNWIACLDEAKGDYAKILWSDDLIDKEFLSRTIPYLERNEDVGFVFTKTKRFDDSGWSEETYDIGPEGIYATKQYIDDVLFVETYPVSPGCAVFRTRDLRKNLLLNIPNKVNSDFSMHAIGNDLLMFLLTAHEYKKFAYVNKSLSSFRAHENSISVQSQHDGKLTLHYMLAKAYFVESYLNNSKYIKRLNTKIWLLLILFSKNKYGLEKVSDFYIDNRNYGISYIELLKKILDKKIFIKVLSLLKRRLSVRLNAD